MTIEMFCPKWYYVGTVSEENQQKIKDLFKEFLSNDENFSDIDGWNCTVLSSYQNPNNSSAPWTEFLDCIREPIDEFMKQMSPTVDIELIPQEAWTNKYRKGHFQECHDHCMPFCNLSMVYFYKEFENPTFRFYMDDHSHYKASGLSNVLTIPSNYSVIPKVKQGDIIIFPSHYTHYVCANKNNEERITITANFYVTPQQVAQGSPKQQQPVQ